MSTKPTATAAPAAYPSADTLEAVAQRFARDTANALETIESTIHAAEKAHEHEAACIRSTSVVTYEYLGRFAAFAKSLEDDIGEVHKRVDAASTLLRHLAMAAEFDGPDA